MIDLMSCLSAATARAGGEQQRECEKSIESRKNRESRASLESLRAEIAERADSEGIEGEQSKFRKRRSKKCEFSIDLSLCRFLVTGVIFPLLLALFRSFLDYHIHLRIEHEVQSCAS